MKKTANVAALGALSLVLAACGSAEDASTDATPDTVEVPAEEALEPIAEEPVADTEATEEVTEADRAVPEETDTEAADAAAAEAAAAEAAAAEAEAALDGIADTVEAGADAVESVVDQ